MGRDKALIEIDGRTLLQGSVDALARAGAKNVAVVGGQAETATALGLTHVADLWPGQGPLGGVIAALRACTADTLAVMPCDLTAASSEAVEAVLSALGNSDVSVPLVQEEPQWLHSAWHARALPELERVFTVGERSLKRAVDGLRVARMLNGDPQWFHDADEPQDLPGSVQ